MKKTNLFCNNGYLIHIIAGVLIMCILFADAYVYLTFTSVNLPYANDESSTNAKSSDGLLVVEDHPLETVLADGDWDGKGSDYENKTNGGIKDYSQQEWVEGNDAYGIINILEIVPDERMGLVGYTIGGCEPLGDTSEEKAWIMDAMANRSAGTEWGSWHNPYYKDKFSAISTSSDVPAMTYEFGYYTGYFKKVAKGHGFYAIGDITYSGNRVTNVVMVSKFATNGESHADTYDYVWVESDVDSEGAYTQKDIYTTKDQLEAGENIYVYDYKKVKYLNNEEFLTIIYPAKVESGGVLYQADGQHGAYDTDDSTRSNGVYGDGTNKKAVELFKTAANSNGNKGIKIFTKTPAQMQLDENKELIDNVDVIIFGSYQDGTYQAAFKAYNDAYDGIKSNAGKSVESYSKGSNDISFEQVMKIYKRVVVDKNLAIACSHSNYGMTNTNIWKLMRLLFTMNTKDKNEAGVSGSGREFYKDFMESYKDDAPYIARARQNLSDSPVDLKAYDFVRIDETTGNFVASDYYNEWYYEGVDGKYTPDYDFIKFRDIYSADTESWPTSIENDWLLAGKGGVGYNADGSVASWWVTGFPLYKYYLYVYNQYYHGNDNEDGLYIYSDTISFIDGQYSVYDNQLVYNDTYTLFRVGSGGGAFNLAGIIDEIKPHKITPPGGGHYEEITKNAYMTMNIVNGDGVNITGGNKVIYFNNYELEEGTLEYIPFSFEVKTTHPISKMELYVSGETSPVAEYDFSVSDTAPIGNSAPNRLEYTYTSAKSGSGSGKLDKSADIPTDSTRRNPDTISGVDDKVWKYEGTINELNKDYISQLGKYNTKITLKVYSNVDTSGGIKLQASDSITVVKRDLYMLN